MTEEHKIRVVLAKLGLDGHDRGIKVVARILRDAGIEVIYLGLRQTTESIVSAAEQEDADAIGLSMHNAGHLVLAPAMMAALDEADLQIPLIIGGIVPHGRVHRNRFDGCINRNKVCIIRGLARRYGQERTHHPSR